MAYCDYDFYINKYYGNLVAEADFPRLAEKASDKIDQFTFNRLSIADDNNLEAKIYGGFEKLSIADSDKVKKAVCALAEVFSDIELMQKAERNALGTVESEDGTIKGKVITSISAGNESISFATGSNSKSALSMAMSDKKLLNIYLYDTVVEYLTGTGLLYAGI